MSDIADDIQVKEEAGESEGEALADILTWSHDCPEWQRDALRRLCVKGELDDDDLDELTRLCKGGGKGSTPLTSDHLPAPEAAATNRITTKSGDIAEQLVTNTLRAMFSKEIDRLGVAGLAIELRKEKTSYGVPHFRVSLIRKPDVRVGEVLS